MPTDNIRNFDFPEGFGNAYVRFESSEHAQEARKHIHLLKYGSKFIECMYHSYELYCDDNFRKPRMIKVEKADADYEGLQNCPIEFN